MRNLLTPINWHRSFAFSFVLLVLACFTETQSVSTTPTPGKIGNDPIRGPITSDDSNVSESGGSLLVPTTSVSVSSLVTTARIGSWGLGTVSRLRISSATGLSSGTKLGSGSRLSGLSPRTSSINSKSLNSKNDSSESFSNSSLNTSTLSSKSHSSTSLISSSSLNSKNLSTSSPNSSSLISTSPSFRSLNIPSLSSKSHITSSLSSSSLISKNLSTSNLISDNPSSKSSSTSSFISISDNTSNLSSSGLIFKSPSFKNHSTSSLISDNPSSKSSSISSLISTSDYTSTLNSSGLISKSSSSKNLSISSLISKSPNSKSPNASNLISKSLKTSNLSSSSLISKSPSISSHNTLSLNTSQSQSTRISLSTPKTPLNNTSRVIKTDPKHHTPNKHPTTTTETAKLKDNHDPINLSTTSSINLRLLSNKMDKLDNVKSVENVDNVENVASVDKVPKEENKDSDLIDLSQRNITSLQGLPDFRTIPVRLLNLSANHLRLIPRSVFLKVLSKLKCLDLADNKVTHIQEKAFANLTSLQHLNLSRNSLTALADETFKGLGSLQQLDLSFNDLTNIAPGALELSSLTRLVLEANQRLGTYEESPMFIATGRRLQTLEATRLSLCQVPSALTHSIRTLHLAENRIRIVRRGEMDSYPLLQLLDLSWNELLEVEDDALGRLEMLTILYLTNNHLAAIPHSLPERLKVLHLERNLVRAILPGDLEGLGQLEVLLLNGNRIGKIADGAFVQVPSLVTLDLSRNEISELPAGSLTGPSKLRVLRLAQLNVSQSLSGVKETAFPLTETEFLITLDLSGSPAVARQWLEDTAALAAARELQELDLSGCGIRTLPEDTLHYLPQLRSLHLRDNALNCTGLEWLAEWMRLQEAEEHREVYCQSPGDLWGTLLVDLQSLQGVNIKEKAMKAIKTQPIGHKLTAMGNQVDGDLLNPLARNTLGYDTSRPPQSTFFTSVNFGKSKKVDRIVDMVEENHVPDARSKTLRTVTVAKPRLTPTATATTGGIIFSPHGILTTTLSSTPTVQHRNSFLTMKKSRDHKGTQEAIKSLSLTEGTHHQQHHENLTSRHTEASMYSSTTPTEDHRAHPGMYLLIIGIMGAALILITLSSRMSRKTREDLQILRAYPHDQDSGELIEVTSLPSVTDLW